MGSSRGLAALAVTACLVGALLHTSSCNGSAPPSIPRPERSAALDPMLVEAIEEAVAEVEADPDDPTRWLRLGKVYQANAHLDLAEPCYRRCIELDDAAVDAWYGLALALERLGRQLEAEETMRSALEHAPSYGPGYWRLGTWCLRDGRIGEAETWFLRATGSEPTLDNGWIGLVRVHLQRDEAEEAAELVRTRLLGGLNDAYARQLLATAYRALGREPEARIEAAWGRRQAEPILLDRRWDDVENAHKTGRGAELERVMFHRAHERHAEAIAILERLDARWPDDVLLLNSLGFAHLRSGDVARAIELLERACALDGATAREHVNLAQAYAEDAKRQPGRRSDALAQLARAIQLDPDSWSAYSF
ncbi:MAG: tetratricopeptide repeat protein, partial [Planctomycetota bacterium]|nr:tetratricopeptide repeat protein [Planctomycetota bacterium]